MSPTGRSARRTPREQRNRLDEGYPPESPDIQIRGVLRGLYDCPNSEWKARYVSDAQMELIADEVGSALSEVWTERVASLFPPIAVVHLELCVERDSPELALFRPTVSEAILRWLERGHTLQELGPLEVSEPRKFRLVIFLTSVSKTDEDLQRAMERPLAPDTGQAVQAALEALAPSTWEGLVRERLAPVLAQPKQSSGQLLDLFRDLESKLILFQTPIRRSLEAILNRISGLSFGSLESNQEVAQKVQSLTASVGLRVRCPKCKKPANLRCSNAGSAVTGAFQFEHTVKGRITHHGGQTTFPQLELMDMPVRRPRKRPASKNP